jgi:hypothetical protein
MTADSPCPPASTLLKKTPCVVQRLRRLGSRLFKRSPAYLYNRLHKGTPADTRRPIRLVRSVAPRVSDGACAMVPDHLHPSSRWRTAAVIDRRYRVSAWMKSLKNALSKALRESGVEAPHWHKGFFDHILALPKSYSEKWDYVRYNPVRAGLVLRWQDWPYLGDPFLQRL